MAFSPEKLLAISSYQPPTWLFRDEKTLDVVAFYFPRRRLMVTNALVSGIVFNIYTLQSGPYRDHLVMVDDARWVESNNGEILLDIHGPTLKGATVVREALERSVDQVQLIHDQTLRLIAHGMDAREAAEAYYMPRHLREGREAYGQVESHVRQVYNGNIGWCGNDVYDINPLSLREEAARTIDAMGGVAAVRKAASEAAGKGGLAN
jgi:alkyl sulfatase BDS1-like metallo-beta-lactamase superfamily hydrolase